MDYKAYMFRSTSRPTSLLYAATVRVCTCGLIRSPTLLDNLIKGDLLDH